MNKSVFTLALLAATGAAQAQGVQVSGLTDAGVEHLTNPGAAGSSLTAARSHGQHALAAGLSRQQGPGGRPERGVDAGAGHWRGQRHVPPGRPQFWAPGLRRAHG